MAKYRLLEAASYIQNGQAVSVKAGRIVELDDEQAASLAGKLDLVATSKQMFPDGAANISPWFAQRELTVTGDKPELPQPTPAPEPAPKRAR